ncbi:hypothetical protein ACFVIM_13515 [Streptomyces sp. NPDC057638]|uniref:hypothetical protein n=1 Tax=Streptomyces sp. NPDC057638 TaxID=3346190 RepID=UPI0036CE0CE8
MNTTGKRRITRTITGALSLLMTAGLGLAAAGPAAAAPPAGTWDLTPPTPSHCNAWKSHTASLHVAFRTCNITSGNYAQSMVVVRSDAPRNVNIEGRVFTNYGGDVRCRVTALAPGGQAGCLGPTKRRPASIVSYSDLYLNGHRDRN